MNEYINPSIIVGNIISTHNEIEEELANANINDDKIVKLMMKQLNQGLLLQTIPNLY